MTMMLKPKSLITNIVSLLLLSFALSCEKNALVEDANTISLNYSKDNVKLDYQGNVTKEGILNLTLTVNHKNRNIVSDQLRIDVISSGYRLRIAPILETKVNELLNGITKENANIIENSLFELIDEYSNSNDVSEFRKEELQGLFYYRSIFKAIVRYHSPKSNFITRAKENVVITPYNGYITGLTPFAATEDIIIDISDFESYLKNYSLRRLTSGDITYISDKLNEYTSSNPGGRVSDDRSIISLQSFTELVLIQGLPTSPSPIPSDGCFILCGGDCGCCGNYIGQCYYAHGGCFIHDYLCESCTPRWFCFSGCKPSSCF